MSEDPGPTPYDQEYLQGRPNAFVFFLLSVISLEFYAKAEGRRFLETGDVSRPYTNSM